MIYLFIIISIATMLNSWAILSNIRDLVKLSKKINELEKLKLTDLQECANIKSGLGEFNTGECFQASDMTGIRSDRKIMLGQSRIQLPFNSLNDLLDCIETKGEVLTLRRGVFNRFYLTINEATEETKKAATKGTAIEREAAKRKAKKNKTKKTKREAK